jgi:hypothetical protein
MSIRFSLKTGCDRPPTNHFERLLKETCPNHTYPIKHKLRECGMMKNFIALGSLT